jgi:quercetin dioxygenase-like cupin family protein
VFLSVNALDVIADSYRIPRLLLDYLMSPLAEGRCVTGEFTAFREVEKPQPSSADADDGHGVTYAIPSSVLAHTDEDEVALVHLLIQSGGQSISHSHPGSEIIYVLEGRIEVVFEDSGLCGVLADGDYAHFSSDLPHWVRNTSGKPAQALVVRYLQLALSDTTGTRLQYLKNASRALKGDSGRKRSAQLVTKIADEMVRPVPFSGRNDNSDDMEVVDRFGLARLLRLITSQGGERFSLRSLAHRASHLKIVGGAQPFTRSRLDRLQNGLSPLNAKEIKVLADLYDVQPFLFYDFLYPTIRGSVVVRVNQESVKGLLTDFKDIPQALIGEEGITMQVPCRRLMDSDTAIVIVTLAEKKSGQFNRHPGHELAVHLKGDLAIEFKDESTISVPNGGYAHYHSTDPHRLVNQGAGAAKFMVIRFQR